MKYELKRREEQWEEYDEENDPDHLSPIVKSRMRTLYEWDGPEARYRSPHPYILDGRRWAAGGDREDRSKQPSLEDQP